MCSIPAHDASLTPLIATGERAAFAQLLLASLDEDAEIEEAWAGEVERRIAEVENAHNASLTPLILL